MNENYLFEEEMEGENEEKVEEESSTDKKEKNKKAKELFDMIKNLPQNRDSIRKRKIFKFVSGQGFFCSICGNH